MSERDKILRMWNEGTCVRVGRNEGGRLMVEGGRLKVKGLNTEGLGLKVQGGGLRVED